MFCSNCGAQASGNFCSKCGASLAAPAVASADGPTDWSQEIRYETLIRHPAVKEAIGRFAAMAQKRPSGEDYLALFDTIAPMGVPLSKLETVVQPLSAQIGIKTGKQNLETVPYPPGTVIVSTLCSFAQRGQPLQHVQQLDDGCLLEAALPSDLFAFEGVLSVRVRKSPSGTQVDATTRIKGQFFDWGKSRRCLETLFADIKANSV